MDAFLGHHRRKGSGSRYLEELTSYLIGAGQRRGWMPFLPRSKYVGITTVVELDKEKIEQYLDAVRAAASLNTDARVCGILAKFLRHLVDEEHLASLPLQIVQPKRVEAQIAVFTEDDVRRIRDVVRGENAATGRSSCCSLTAVCVPENCARFGSRTSISYHSLPFFV